MSRIEIIDTGIIFRNPMPQLRSRHAYFPSLVALENGNLVAGMDIGSAFEAIDVRSYACHSSDQGRTWTEPVQIFEPDETFHAISTTCRLSLLPDGSLIGLACLFDRTRTDYGLVHPETNGFVRTEFAIVRSAGGGHTWTRPAAVRLPVEWHHFETCSPIFVANAQRRLVMSSPWPNLEARHPDIPAGIAFASDDGGASWTEVVMVFPGSQGDLTAWEQKIVRLSDGRLLVVCWSFDPKRNGPMNNRYVISKDEGKTFGPPMASPLSGETCTPIALPDNHVLCVYRRFDTAGLWAHLGRIEGDGWTPLADEPIWGGSIYSPEVEDKGQMAKMAQLQFGLPTLVRLKDGQIMAAFWCVENNVSNIRWYTIRVTVGPISSHLSESKYASRS